MTHDIHTLRMWIRIVLFAAAIFTTLVPILYATFPWRTHRAGRLFMYQALAFAATLDVSAAFTIWAPTNVLLLFWIDACVLTLVAVTEYSMAFYLLIIRKPKREDTPPEDEQQGL